MTTQISPSVSKSTNEFLTAGEARDLVKQIKCFALDNFPETAEMLQFYKERKPSQITNRDLLTELSWIGYSSGFRFDVINKYWPSIRHAFYDFDVERVASLTENIEHEVMRVCNETGFKNRRKAKWCILNAKRIIELEEELNHLGGLKGFFIDLKKITTIELVELTPSLIDRLKFRGIGKTTIFHLLKNIGIDIFKPDIHVCRIMNKLGLTSDEKSSIEIFRAMEFLSVTSGLRINELDTLFFVYGKNTNDNLDISLMS